MERIVNTKWIRVNRYNPCPICGKPDWCLISRDGEAAICARIESDKPAGHMGAGWIHLLDSPIYLPPTKPVAEVKQTARALPDLLNKAYSSLIKELPLFETHKENLISRGLSTEEIEKLNYKTMMPDGRRELVKKLQAEGVKLAGIPGFYFKSGDWQLAGPIGIAIPVRNISSRIIGIQVRCDKTDGAHYKWLSSMGFPEGCSSGAPIHVAGRRLATNEVWVTEGPLKADIISLRLNRMVLAVAGVGNWRRVIPIVKELKPGRVIIAFDMDKINNPSVKLHSESLINHLVRQDIQTFEANWDSRYKGLDDLLVKEET
jgi:hypothetical protein